jgi:PAS domain S-box-containing protein
MPAWLVNRLEKDWQQSEEKFRTTFRESPDVILILNRDNKTILSVNQTVQTLLGYQKKSLEGQNFIRLCPSESTFNEMNIFEKLDTDKAIFESQSFLRADGTTCPMDITANFIPWDDEQAIMITLRDITDQLQAEEARREVEILREVDQIRSELIANVSHDFRTPLGLIKILCTTLLREDVKFDPQTYREFLQDIEVEANHLEGLVTNVLDLSRIENGRLQLNKSPTILNPLIEETISAMRIRSDKHQLIHKLANMPLMASVDPQRIEEVLRNLIDNAMKYSPDGGNITIEGYEQSSEIVLVVHDEGIGIPADEVDKVFERFYRGSNTNVRTISGTGLGLAVCQGIIKAHDGRIWAESALSKGSSFYITLPATSQKCSN